MNGGLSQWASKPRLGLIGNPENRRIIDFQVEAQEQGWPKPICLPYEGLLSDSSALEQFEADFVRIDSPGENAGVADALIALGGGPRNAGLEFGEISFLREYHKGFCALLKMIETCGVRCINSPRSIAQMFDKWRCHEVFLEKQVERPPSERATMDASEFFAWVRDKPSGRFFLKPLHGSSASGVCALRWAAGRMQLIAPIRILFRSGRPILINSLEVQTYSEISNIETILRLLLPQGMIMERWIPKFTVPGGAIDVRVLVIAGEARHYVVRQSRSPMTNLHLGNRRCGPEILEDALGAAKCIALFHLAERAANCFPEALYAGVDILIDTSRRLYVGEINAFGDLLPRITHRGESAYAAIVRTCYAQSCFV